MRTDSTGKPDVCREVYTPVPAEVQEFIKYIKLSANTLIAFCRVQIDKTEDKEVRRWFAIAASGFEDGAVYAVKALTYENFKLKEVEKEDAQR